MKFLKLTEPSPNDELSVINLIQRTSFNALNKSYNTLYFVVPIEAPEAPAWNELEGFDFGPVPSPPIIGNLYTNIDCLTRF